MNQNLRDRSRSPTRTGSESCKFDREKPGSCRFGGTCRFIHSSGIKGASRAKTDEQIVCFDFQNKGKCKRDDACRYRHENPRFIPCRDFKSGHCRRGNMCRFSHGQNFDNQNTMWPPQGDSGKFNRQDNFQRPANMPPRGMPEYPRQNDPKKPKYGSDKSTVCFDFQNRGKCSYGNDCKYNHLSLGETRCKD